jgi:hypothetical protein
MDRKVATGFWIVLVASLGGAVLFGLYIARMWPDWPLWETRHSWYADRAGEIRMISGMLERGQFQDVTVHIRGFKIRAEIFGIPRRDYIDVLRDALDESGVKDETEGLPEELVRIQEGEVLYGLFCAPCRLSETEAAIERQRFVEEVARSQCSLTTAWAAQGYENILDHLLVNRIIDQAYVDEFLADVEGAKEEVCGEKETAAEDTDN